MLVMQTEKQRYVEINFFAFYISMVFKLLVCYLSFVFGEAGSLFGAYIA